MGLFNRFNRKKKEMDKPSEKQLQTEMTKKQAPLPVNNAIKEVPEPVKNRTQPSEIKPAQKMVPNIQENDINQHLVKTEETNRSSGQVYREINGRYIVGEPGGTFIQIPFLTKRRQNSSFHNSDIIADIAKINNIMVMGTSVRGESHYANRVPRQDSFIIDEVIGPTGHYAIAVISDGVGNSSDSDQFSEFLVNYTSYALIQILKEKSFEQVDWNQLIQKLWRASLSYCYEESGSKNIADYFAKWAGTLEFVVIDTNQQTDNPYVHITVAGDGGAYELTSSKHFRVIKPGKRRVDNLISNDVDALPMEPKNSVVKFGKLKKGDGIFIVTDGLGDAIEEVDEVRMFFGDKLLTVNNLFEYIRIVSVAIKQYDDDKTGVYIKHFESKE